MSESKESTCKLTELPVSRCNTLNHDQSNQRRRHIPSASTALITGGILGLLQSLFLISTGKPLLNFMGVDSVSIYSSFLCCFATVLVQLMRPINVLLGICNAVSCTKVLDTEVSWCSSCPTFIGDARCLSWTQRHNNSSLCYWYLLNLPFLLISRFQNQSLQ